MARAIREDYAGAWHHVMNRGRNREQIVVNDNDGVAFLDSVESAIARYGVEVHGYSLMPNHYHLLVRSPHGNLSDAMKHLGSTYTLAYNRRHNKDGTLFRGRFKSQLVKDEAYLMYLFSYIHLNPVRAGLVSRVDSLSAWTSYRRLMDKDQNPAWLCLDGMSQVFGDSDKMLEITRQLHRKQEPWPAGMNRDTGWFRWNQCPANAKKVAVAPAAKGIDIKELLNTICVITDVPIGRLTESVRGPGGNPQRRFACWALFHGTFLTQAQIGQPLKLTKLQVAKNVQRCKTDSQLSDWKEQWRHYYPDIVSIVST